MGQLDKKAATMFYGRFGISNRFIDISTFHEHDLVALKTD